MIVIFSDDLKRICFMNMIHSSTFAVCSLSMLCPVISGKGEKKELTGWHSSVQVLKNTSARRYQWLGAGI